MLRGPKTPLRVKENESACPEEKQEASFTPSRDHKSCRVTKPIRASKENFSHGNQPRAPKRALKCPKGPQENLGCAGSWQLPGSCFGGLSEPPLPLHNEDFSSSPAAALGNDFCTPERDRGEGEADFGLCEQREKPGDFAAVMSAELGMAQQSFGQPPTGASPHSQKLRRRSTIGLRGSPENNTLIRYLAQQRSSRQRETFTQISPFNPANVRPLKDKIDSLQASFESLQEAEGELSQERGSSQNKSPFKKEPNLQHWSEKFTLGNRGAALKGNFSGNGTKRSRNELRICSILSPPRAGIVPDPPAAAKEWIFEQQNPVKSLETVVTGGPLQTSHVSRCDHSDAVSALSPRKAEPVEDLGMLGGNQTPGTPLGSGNIPSCDLSQSSSLLRSILKKTPGMELRDSPKEYPNSAIDRGGDESAAVSNCVKAFETLQTEPSDNQSSKTPKKKKVTFGEVLSPEIFDQNLPANTPLRRGASPGCPQGQSPRARPHLSEEPLPLLDFGWDEEGVEPLPEPLEDSVAAEAPPAVENAEVAESDKPAMVTTRSTKRKQCRALAEGTEQSSGDTNTESNRDTKNPRRSKIQRQRNPSTAGPKKTQKSKYPVYGKRRKKKAKRSLYGARETASKKPLLSPIPEIPEVFSSVSSPNSPKADAFFTGDAALGEPRPRDPLQAGGTCGQGLLEGAAAPSPGLGDPEGPPGSLEAAAAAAAAEFSNAVLDAEDTPEYFQQSEVTPCKREARESSSSLTEKEDFQGNLLTGLEILAQQDVQEAAQRTKPPPNDPVRGDPARRRRRSSRTFFFPPVESLEAPGADVPVSFYNVEEFLSAPRGRGRAGSLQGCRSSAELRVRRSMRLSRDSLSHGLAWVQLPGDSHQQPPLAAAARAGRRSSTSILAGAENIQLRKQNLLPLPAPGKENEGSAPLAAAPGRRSRRRSLLEGIAC